MSAEYEGKQDTDKTVKIWPRPLTRTQDRIRAENLTSDPGGFLPTDNMNFWQGLDWVRTADLVAHVNANLELERAIDDAWY